MIKTFIKLWLPVIIWAGLIFFLSSIPDLKSGLETFWDTILRKIAHIVEYGIFFLLFARAMNPHTTGLKPGNFGVGVKKPLVWSIVFSILYAVSDEFHQSFVPGRHMALLDICFDSTGVLIGYLVQLRINKNLTSSEP